MDGGLLNFSTNQVTKHLLPTVSARLLTYLDLCNSSSSEQIHYEL